MLCIFIILFVYGHLPAYMSVYVPHACDIQRPARVLDPPETGMMAVVNCYMGGGN